MKVIFPKNKIVQSEFYLQNMYPYYQEDISAGKLTITKEVAQELLD